MQGRINQKSTSLYNGLDGHGPETTEHGELEAGHG